MGEEGFGGFRYNSSNPIYVVIIFLKFLKYINYKFSFTILYKLT